MKKRLLTFLFLFLITFQALAIVPIIWGIGTVMAETSIGVQVSAAALVVGGAIYSLGISRTGNGGEFRTDTLYQANTPRPATAAEAAAGFTAGYPHVIPPSTGSAPASMYWILSGKTFVDFHLACTSYVSSIGKIWLSDWDAQCNWSDTVGGNPSGYATIFSGLQCSSGYTVSGSTCVLSAPDSVPRPNDGFCPILRTGNSYAVDITDPDCTGDSATPQFAVDGSYSISSPDGRFVTSRLTTGGDRVTTIGTSDPATSTTKIIEITTRQTTDPAVPPTVIGKKEGILPGIGAPADPLPVGSPSPAVTVDLSAVTAAIAAQTAADAAARAADAAATSAAATAAQGNLSGGENTRIATDASMLSSLNNFVTAAQTQQTVDQNNVSGFFSFAPVASSCAPWSKTVHGKTATIDFCTYTEMIRSTIAWLFALFGAYTIYQIIFRAKA